MAAGGVRRGVRLTLLASLSLLSSCLCRGPAAPRRVVVAAQPAAPPAEPAMDSEPTFVSMRNVDFHVGGDIVLHIRHLRGLLRGKDGVVNFDQGSSFVTFVDSAEAGLTAADLTNLMNNHVFAYRGAPLRNINVTLVNNHLIQTGILHKGVDIPFKIKSEVSLTSDGRLRLHPVDTDIFCVDGDKLMKALGLSMEKMVDVSKAKGVSIKGNDFIIDPIAVLPPPTIRGRVVAVRIDGDQLVQTIGPAPGEGAGESRFAERPPTPPDTTVRNYMYYRGGKLHFGRKLLMSDADMQVVDAEQSDPFDFNLDQYMVQLVAGYSRTLANAGLWVEMPDFHRVFRLEQVAGGEVTSPRDTACNCPPPKPPVRGARTKP